MNEFEKNRISYIIAFFAATFAIYPLIKDASFYQPSIRIRSFLIFFSIWLGISVYLYALSYMGINSIFKNTKKAADIIYQVTIILPLFYLFYYAGSYLNWYFKDKKLDYLVPWSSWNPLTNDFFYNLILILTMIVFVISVGIIGTDIEIFINNKLKRKKENNEKAKKSKEIIEGPTSCRPPSQKVRVTLHNKAVRARACMVCVPDLAPEIKVSAARHTDSLGASTAREKGSAGPVHRRRDCWPLYKIPPTDVARASGRRAKNRTIHIIVRY